MNFEVGTIVWLKSGGPSMTVVGIFNLSTEPTIEVQCSWFTDAGEYGTCRVDVKALTTDPADRISEQK